MSSNPEPTDTNSYLWWSRLYERKLWDMNNLSCLGTVCDLLLDTSGNLLALGFRGEHWFEAGKSVSLSFVKAVTPERVNIQGDYRVNTFNPRPPASYSAQMLGMLGTQVFNTHGHSLGGVTDICSVLATGQPIAIKSIFASRNFQFPIEKIERVGRQGIIVELDSKTETDLAEILSYGDEPLDVGLILTPEPSQSEIGIISERFAQKKRSYLLGKTCPRNKYDINGMLLVSSGEVLTPETLDRLERAGKIEEIFFDLTFSGRQLRNSDYSAEGG